MMPKSVLQSVIKLRNMTGEELVAYFNAMAERTGKPAYELAKSAERRHGYKDRPYYSQHFNHAKTSRFYRKMIQDIEKRYQDR